MSTEDATQSLLAFTTQWSAGDMRAALHSARDACRTAPERAEPHYAHGQATLALGDPAAAERAFAAALQRAPQWADAWVNYGIARYRQGAVGDAKAAMRQALLRQPGHAAAIANLGAFLRITGEVEAAEALLLEGIARDPGNSGARLNLAADLLMEERPAEALAVLDDARLPDAPDVRRHWLLQQSLALLQLSRPAEARAMLDRVAALGQIPSATAPLWHWRQVLLHRCEGNRAAALREAALMAAALEAMGPHAVPEHRIMGHYELAKFWSAENEHSAAFAHWKAGHLLLRHSQPFSRQAHREFVDASIAAFPRERFAAGVRARNGDVTPVFIVGMPRSGTTLCEQILAAHRDVHGAGERVALARCFEHLGGGASDTRSGTRHAEAPRRIATRDATALDAAAADYLAELHALAPAALRVVDKMPANYLYLGLVGLLLPEARIIHCVRDPRDIGLSIFTFRFHGAHGYAHDLADLGWTIAQQHRLMAHWRAVLPNPVLTLPLSDWVTDFDGTLARVLAFLSLPADPNCTRFYATDSRVRTVSRAQVRQPVHAGGLGRWRQYEAELAPLIRELNDAGLLADWRNTALS